MLKVLYVSEEENYTQKYRHRRISLLELTLKGLKRSSQSIISRNFNALLNF